MRIRLPDASRAVQKRCWQSAAPASIRPAEPTGRRSPSDAALCRRVAPGILAAAGFCASRFQPLKDVMATVEHSDGTLGAHPEEGVRRRDFINIAAVSFAGIGGVAILYPLINQMNPSADVLALATIEVDLSQTQPGQAI